MVKMVSTQFFSREARNMWLTQDGIAFDLQNKTPVSTPKPIKPAPAAKRKSKKSRRDQS